VGALDALRLLALEAELSLAISQVEAARLAAIGLRHLPGSEQAAKGLLAAQMSLVGSDLAPLRQLCRQAREVAARADSN
jgi:hypothetical protein